MIMIGNSGQGEYCARDETANVSNELISVSFNYATKQLLTRSGGAQNCD